MVESRKKRLSIVALHMLVGILLFYFLLHPLAMVVRAGDKARPTADGMWQAVVFQLSESFSFHMLPMAYVFIVAGGIVGLLFGLYRLDLAQRRSPSTAPTSTAEKRAEELISEGENHYVEFKSSIRYDFRKKCTNRGLEGVIAKTLAGFMNADGGYLLIGVTDHGVVLGLEMDYMTLRDKNQDGFERRIFELVSTMIGAEYCHLCTVSFHSVDAKTTCVVKIETSAEPVYISEPDSTKFFVRVGNATHQLSVKEAVKYIRMKEHRHNELIHD